MGASRSCWWYTMYIGSSWLTNLGHGLSVAVLGPTQPYLAKNVGVNIDVINLVWTFGFVGYFIGSVATGFVYKRYFNSSVAKLAFLWSTMCLNGFLMVAVPFINNFGLLVFVRFVQNVALGGFITADTSMVVYTMGPVKSRPFTNALHAWIGGGFLAATFLVRPFLPEAAQAVKDRDEVCFGGKAGSLPADDVIADETEAYRPELMLGVDKIAWPFIISGLWCVVFSFGYLILACLPLSMPRYYSLAAADDHHDDKSASASNGNNDLSHNDNHNPEPTIHYWKFVVVLVFVYYVISCGIERIYQPMAYTYGLCGPLQLSPSAAVVIDSSYNGGFMAGRIVSAIIGGFVRPRNMIVVSLVACVASASVLVAMGGSEVYGLYAGTGVLGFFVSWQFGSCYSWVAKKMDITGRLAPVFFLGCGVGGAIFPPLSGFVFTSSWGPNSILHLTLAVCLVQCLVYALMWTVARKKNTYSYSFTGRNANANTQL